MFIGGVVYKGVVYKGVVCKGCGSTASSFTQSQQPILSRKK